MSLKAFPVRSTKSQKAITLEDYLQNWQSDKGLSANTAGRILRAIGEPEVIDTSKDERLGRIFSNRTIKRYKAFSDMLGLEDTVSTIVNYFAYAAQGAQQKKKILYVNGPPGSGKSERIVEPIKRLAEKEPMYVLAVKEGERVTISPFFESPLGLFDPDLHGAMLEETYKIPRSAIETPMSRWAAGWLEAFDGDLSLFHVVPVMPSMVTRTGIAQVVPGNPEHPDLSTLIGIAGRNDDFSDYKNIGGLNRTTQGVMEFLEMFKAHPGLLTPLLAAPQDRKYAGAGGIGELPYQGIIIAHSNEEEWINFRREKVNPALVDRILDIPVPYCLRVTECAEIYRRHLEASGYKGIPCPENTLELAAMFAVMTRMDYTQDGRIDLYDGHHKSTSVNANVRADDARREENGREGMAGISERLMLTVLPEIADSNPDGPALDPVLVLRELQRIAKEKEVATYLETQYLGENDARSERDVEDIVDGHLKAACYGVIEQLIKKAYTANIDAFVLNQAQLYVACADAWGENEDLKDPESDVIWKRADLEAKLTKFETGITNPKDFRFEIVKAALRHNSKPENQGIPVWKSFDESRWQALYANIVPKRSEMLLVIQYKSREAKSPEKKKHEEFVERFCALGCTPAQVRRMVDFYCDHGKHLG